METQVSDPWLGGVALLLAVFSVAIWFALFAQWHRGPLLPYRPRRPVPWSGVWILLPLLLVGATIYNASQGDAAAEEEHPSAAETIERISLGTAQELAFVAAFLAVVILSSGAKRSDLGLPVNAQEFVSNVRVGVIAWLASLLPVYFVEIILYNVVGESEGHPLIRMLMKESSPTLFAMVFIAAVIVAPICEEILFRLLLQGWLEKWEDKRLGWRTLVTLPVEPSVDVNATAESPDGTVADSSTAVTIPIETINEELQPPRFGLAGLPYGSVPIVISSLLFGLAHAGTGTDPIPLFVFALVLGYIYQRTHRIVPSIIAHALFNGMSLFALWRILSAGAQ